MQNLNILKKQEELLQFEHFSNDDAFELGSFMVSYARKHNITIAISIRLNNGCILFQHCPDGTNLLNQKWMDRKFNFVKLMERSSLLSTFTFEHDNDTSRNTRFIKQRLCIMRRRFSYPHKRQAKP
ncbi:MAG: heme-binding protein [Lachnospiraceae bacterium]